MDKFLDKLNVKNWSKASFMGVLGAVIIIGYLLTISYLVPQVSILFSKQKISEEAFERMLVYIINGLFQLAVMVVTYFFGKMTGKQEAESSAISSES